MVKFRCECFEGYQLNRMRNFLPEMTVQLSDVDELFDFCSAIIKRYGCENSAIFAIEYGDTMHAILNIADSEDEVEVYSAIEFDVDFFANVDASNRLCCYGLIIETRPGEWKIIAR